MNLLNLLIGGCALLNTWMTVQGDGCAKIETNGLPEVYMCKKTSWVLGRVFISVTSDSMGDNTGCICVIRSGKPELESATTFYLKGADSELKRCTESQIQINSFSKISESDIQNFTCKSRLNSTFYTGRTTGDVTITLTRPDTSVGVSYCLLVEPDQWKDEYLELSCQSGPTPFPSTTSSPTAVPSTTSPSTTVATTRLTASTTFSALSTSASTITPSSSSALPTSLSQSTMTSTASPPSTSAPDGNSVSTGSFSTTQAGSLPFEGQDFPIGAVAGIVLGAIALICLTVIVIVVVYIRHRRRPASKPETGADNSDYTSLSDVARVNPCADPNYAVIQSERSSSQPGGNDATAPASVYETVDADGSVTRDSNYVNSSNVGKGTE